MQWPLVSSQWVRLQHIWGGHVPTHLGVQGRIDGPEAVRSELLMPCGGAKNLSFQPKEGT